MALNTKYSITDYLKSQKKDSSYAARQQMAVDYGITNYSGTADQNARLLNSLKSGQQSSSQTREEAPAPATVSGYQKAPEVTDYYNRVQNMESSKPGAYSSQYQGEIENILDSILNRDKFSYDLNADQLYQQYKDSYMRQGDLAMRDTMGSASALTGGYGSTYAQNVGSQAYDGYLSRLNDKIPELYQIAYNQYRDEGNDLYSQLNAVAGLDNTDYGRYRDTMSDYYTDRDYYNSRYDQEYGYDYGRYQDTVDQQNWREQFEYQKQQDTLRRQDAQKKKDDEDDIDKLTVGEAQNYLYNVFKKKGIATAKKEMEALLKDGVVDESTVNGKYNGKNRSAREALLYALSMMGRK